MGTSCIDAKAKKNEVAFKDNTVSKDNTVQTVLAFDGSNQNDSNNMSGTTPGEKGWIYFNDLNQQGYLYKMHLEGGEKVLLPVQDVDKWFIHKHKIIYTTVPDYSMLDPYGLSDTSRRKGEKIFVNQLKMMNLDGTGQVTLAENLWPLDSDLDEYIVVTYRPLFVRNNKIYFETGLGIPYTDVIISILCSINMDGTEFRNVQVLEHGVVHKIFFSDQGFYFIEQYEEESRNLYFINLDQGSYHLIQKDADLAGTYKEHLYYAAYVQHENGGTLKLYRIPVNSTEAEEIGTLAEGVDYIGGVNLTENKVYFSYYPSDITQGEVIKSIDLDTQLIDAGNGNNAEFLYTYEDSCILEAGEKWYYYVTRDHGYPGGISKINLNNAQKIDLLKDINVDHIQVVSAPEAN